MRHSASMSSKSFIELWLGHCESALGCILLSLINEKSMLVPVRA